MVWVYRGFVVDVDDDYYYNASDDEHDDIVGGVVDQHWCCRALGSMWRQWVDGADGVCERVYLHRDK